MLKKELALCAALLLSVLFALTAFAGGESHRHEAGEPVTQEVTEPGCDTQKEYREVITCKICGQLLSSKLIIGKDTKHEPAVPMKENIVASTCAAPGQYESVTYCKKCGLELQRIWKEIPEVDYHISEYSLKRTVVKKEGEGYFLSFADKAFPDLKKADWTPKEELVGKTFAPGQYFAGDGKERTCADGEWRCALCGVLLSPAIPHTWDGGTVVARKTETTPGRIRYTCLVLGCGAELVADADTNHLHPYGSSFLVRMLNKITGEYYYLYSPTNGNTEITTADARLVLRYSVGLGNYDKVITPELFKYADADRDGKITPADARLYLRAAVGLTTV